MRYRESSNRTNCSSKSSIHNDSTGRWLSFVNGATSISHTPVTDTCIISGIDMTIYVDDSTAMPEAEFHKLREFLRELYHSFESNRSKCGEVGYIPLISCANLYKR